MKPAHRYSMLRVRSPRNSIVGCGDLDDPRHQWAPAKHCYADGPSFFGAMYLKVPGTWDNGDPITCRVYPRARIGHVESLMLHEGEWYWIVRRAARKGRRNG